jgi:hypothetical protein
VKRPGFFIIGAMKSGTTSLHQYLAQHPDVFMSEPKEPGFFVEELMWSRGLNWYLGLFAGAGGACVLGESSTHYTKLPTYQGVAERIRHFNPDACFVYVMRDPLDRMVSHYWHNVRTLHLEAERRPFAQAVREDVTYAAYGDYAMQLEPYLSLFGRNRVLTLTFEALVAEPARVVSDVCTWLGLPDSVPADVFARRWNARPERVVKARGNGLLNRLRFSRMWDRLAPLVPERVRRLGAELAEEAVVPEATDLTPELEELRPRVLAQVETLMALLGRSFPEWKTTLHARA